MGTILKSLCAVRIFVDDLDRARRFYRDVLELREKSASLPSPASGGGKGGGWAVFDIDGREIILEAVAADDPERALVGRLLAVSFAVDDVDDAYRNLVARGVSFPEPPMTQPWGGRLAFPTIPTETF
jgi:catechol 2,3-dioxygenase-like lactoylglutathione lyase family enzyme